MELEIKDQLQNNQNTSNSSKIRVNELDTKTLTFPSTDDSEEDCFYGFYKFKASDLISEENMKMLSE